MTKKKMCVAGLSACVSVVLIALSVGCKKDNPVTPPPKDPIELLYPVGGESFKLGDTVTVRWRINDNTNLSSIALERSTINGMAYSLLHYTSIPLDTTFCSWIVDSISTQCIIRVRDYLDYSVFDKSGVFTVHN